MHTTNLPKVGDSVEDGRLVAEQQRRALDTLDELLTQCAAFVELSGGEREWLAAKPVGNELLSWAGLRSSGRYHVNVSEAVAARRSIRAFKPDPVPGETVRGLLEAAKQAPSGGNLQPWRVYALGGAPLAEFKALVAAKLAAGESETPEYAVYPHGLWEPFRTRRRETGAQRYAALGASDKDKTALYDLSARNYRFFDAPVALFFWLDRRLGPPQWSDMGMFMQSFMLLAVERGLDTCPQESWANWPKTVRDFLALPDELMLFAGMALGHRDPDAPLNAINTARAPFEAFAEMRGF